MNTGMENNINLSQSKNRMRIRSSDRRCSMRKDVLKIFAKFTRKHFCQSLLLIKMQALKRDFGTGCFPVNFAKFIRKSFLTEQLWANDIGALILETAHKMKSFIKYFFSKCEQIRRYHIEISLLICRANHWTDFYIITADLVTFTEEILNGKLHFLCSESCEGFLPPNFKAWV